MGEITKEIINKYYSIDGTKGKNFPVSYVMCNYVIGFGEVYTWRPYSDPLHGDGHMIIPIDSEDKIKIFVQYASEQIKLPYDWNPKHGVNLNIEKDRIDYMNDEGFKIYPTDWRIQLETRIEELMVPKFLDKCWTIAATLYRCSVGDATETDVINATKITLDIIRRERGE